MIDHYPGLDSYRNVTDPGLSIDARADLRAMFARARVCSRAFDKAFDLRKWVEAEFSALKYSIAKFGRGK